MYIRYPFQSLIIDFNSLLFISNLQQLFKDLHSHIDIHTHTHTHTHTNTHIYIYIYIDICVDVMM